MTGKDREQVNNSKSRGARIAVVVLMIAALLASVWFMQKFMCIPFSKDEIRTINLHKEPKDSIDVLLVGSSATYSDYSAPYAYEKFGFTSFPYAIGGSTCTMWKPAVQDALATQRPKLVVVDVFGGGYERGLIDTRSNQLSIVMSHTARSRQKVETAKELSGLVENTSTASFLFPFIKYHNNVPNCIKSLPDRLRLEAAGPSPLKGVYAKSREVYLEDVEEISFTDETAPLDPKTEAIIRDFIDYCRSEDLEVLFVKYPSVLISGYEEEMEINLRCNRILQIAEEEGCHALNMQKHFNDIGLEERADFYNHSHTNVRGQKKITAFLGSYIQNELGIAPSDLSDDLRAEWDESIVYYNVLVDMAEENINNYAVETLGDDPATIREIKKRLGSG